jgi:aldehyde:ferredoxin oxidoreductase
LEVLGIGSWNETNLQYFAKKLHIMKYNVKKTLGFDIKQETLPEKLTSVYTTSGKVESDEYKLQLRLFEDLLTEDERSLS